MGKKILDNVSMGMTWTSYISSVEGVLRSAGLWEGETYQLMGMTGIGFHFIMHRNICPSSVTVYDWMSEHLAAMDRIGIHTDIYCVMDINMNTFPKIQQDAIDRIRQSIDHGQAVVAWAPTGLLEFGVIYGYDDTDGVFFVQECTGRPCDPLLYENLGKSEVPMLFYQLFKNRVDIDMEKAFRDSLQYAVNEWRKTFHVNCDYSSGHIAYDYLIQAMEKGNFDDFGLTYNLAVYADSKQCITKYLEYMDEVSHSIKDLGKAILNYRQIIKKFNRLTQLFPFTGSSGSGCTIDRSGIPEALNTIRECLALEEEAFHHIESVLEI